jgi:hypothetical protein
VTARCDLTDLLVDSCSHCRGLDEPFRPGAVTVGAHFVAQHNGECTTCDGPIVAGEQAGYLDNGVSCWDCYDGTRAPR